MDISKWDGRIMIDGWIKGWEMEDGMDEWIIRELGYDLQRLFCIGITCPILGVMLRILHEKAYDDKMIVLVGKGEVYQDMSKALFNILPLCLYKDQNKRKGRWVDSIL